MRGDARLLQVGGRGVDAGLQIADMARDQRLIRDLSAADHAVHVFVDQVHVAIADAQIELDLRIADKEVGQGGHQHQPREGGGHVHPQTPARRRRRSGQAGFSVVDVGQQPDHPRVIGGAIGGDVHLPGGAVQQAHPQPGLQVLYQLRDRGAAHVQRVGGLGEAAGFHHPGEGLHCVEPVHLHSTGADCLDSTNNPGGEAAFIPRPCRSTVALHS